jgi:transcription elongation factor Elf1
MNSGNCSVDNPTPSVRGAVHDSGSSLVLTCGQCGKEHAIQRISEVRVYVHGINVVVAFDLASMSRHGEFSLLCPSCATAESPAPVLAG